jgi:hypothetical protein
MLLNPHLLVLKPEKFPGIQAFKQLPPEPIRTNSTAILELAHSGLELIF